MTDDRAALMAALAAQVTACTRCDLAQGRGRAVPGEGPADAEVMFIGEAPGYHEDVQGRPFVGPSGRFLDELLASIGFARAQVFITNIVKCRPPNNRDPLPTEIAACAPTYLDAQISAQRPLLIVTLGRFSMAHFAVFRGKSISKIHGQPHEDGGLLLYPMFHPAAALHRQDLVQTLRDDMLRIPSLLADARQTRRVVPPTPPTSTESPEQLSLF